MFAQNLLKMGSGNTSLPYTVALVHSDDVDASTNFQDASSTGSTVVAVGNAQHKTDQQKFGGSSIYCDGDGDAIEITHGEALAFDGDFTVECWVRITAWPTAGKQSQGYLFHTGAWGGAGTLGVMLPSGTLISWITSAGYVYTPGSTNLGQWYHVAAVRKDGTITIYKDGSAITSSLCANVTETPTSL